MSSILKKWRKGKNIRKVMASSLAVLLTIPLMAPQASAASKGNADMEVETRIKDTLKIKGKEYRDLNDNGKLDSYENWTLPVDKRVKDLVSKMTLEEKAGMMLISSHYMNESAEGDNLLSEADRWSETNRWAQPGDPNYEFDEPVLDASGTTNGILDRNLRYFIIRQNPSADVLATWINQIQEVAERSRLGIPVVMTSNPRNHINTSKTFGISESVGEFSVWPGELGLAASRDTELVREFAETSAQEFTASGIRKGYMYMADIITDPLWTRTEGTFGEHPELAADMIREIVLGYQGKELGPNSVSLTTKHFPGGGARDDGKDPHYLNGQFNPYPTEGSLLKYHIPAFKAAIEAGTTSIMPYYAYPSNEHSAPNQLGNGEEFEEVGFAYNKAIIEDLLRDDLGFKGYVNTDTGITTSMPWGVEELTKEERYAKALDAGVNIFSGEADPTYLINAVNDGLVKEKRLDESVTFLLTEMMQLGLFEDPYVDPENALAVATNPESQELADEAHRKSIVLLRNDDHLLPLNDDKIEEIKLYVEIFSNGDDKENTAGFIESIRNYDKSVTITNNIEEATHAFVWVRPSTPKASNPQLTIGPENGIDDVDRINEIQDTVPTILALNMTNPWLIDNVEGKAKAVISTFGVKTEAIVDVIRGKFNPTGKLPFTIPANQEELDKENGDVPGYDEDPSYVFRDKNGVAYAYNFGLSYDSKDGQTTISGLKQLINKNLSKHGHQKSLLNQIEKAEKYLATGNTSRAISTLEDLKKKVDKLPKKHVPNEVKQEINQAIDEVIANL
ncbi:glycoside hydrolase family 3 protein [Metabacillus litoralis]|uniref:glycoside hydrolase family 3 protein n=1 Tax=Metabacillus litoralis TaxID=152268 RepID=UPI00203C1FC3|nr:glycoside hydrolase family 3 N-terminal domain-containing protein [Metabacillus litoralis]MCM3652629.1 glycoside hydrolase family 3 C-terminal domain-containing protein [Metabacillus litoralis]